MKKDREIKTVYLKEEIECCDSVEELKETIIPLLKSQQEQWMSKINAILQETGYTKSKFAELCGTSRVSLDKWLKGAIPKSRETFLRIGMAANYDIERMNQLLQRYGQYPALYSKSLEDCICIFVINNFSEDRLSKYLYILGKIRSNIEKTGDYVPQNIDTEEFDEKLAQVKDEGELGNFITENIALFSFSYHKFYAYVKANINANYSSNVHELAEAQGWSSSLRQCVSSINQGKWYPTRNKIISLGLHLSMDHEQIDEMLELAHMEPLCAKNIFESVIMFILEDASLNNILDAGADDYDPDELCRYAKQVLNEVELPEIEEFISELPENEDEW